jgi:hypothetical protein
VRLKDPGGTQIPTGNSNYYPFDSSGNFTFANLDVGAYTWAALPSTGNSWHYSAGPTVVLGVSVPYIQRYTP